MRVSQKERKDEARVRRRSPRTSAGAAERRVTAKPKAETEARCPVDSGGHSDVAEGHTILSRAGGPDSLLLERACGGLLKTGRSRASRRATPDARHHGGRQDDPAHKPAASVDAVRVPHGRRESAGHEAKTMTALLAWSLSGPPGTAAGLGGWNEAAPQPQCQPGEGARHEPASQV